MPRSIASELDAARLQHCSLAAQGLYLRLSLLAARTGGRIGQAPDQVARTLGMARDDWAALLAELGQCGAVLVEPGAAVVVPSLVKRDGDRVRKENSRKKCDVTKPGCDVTAPPDLPPIDHSWTDSSPAYNPELVPVARRVLDHYKRVVQTTHPVMPGVSTTNVIRLLRAGLTEPQLLASADHYAAHCRRANTEKQHRLSAKVFFGDSRAFEEYLQAPQADRPSGPKQMSMSEVIEKRKGLAQAKALGG